VLKSKYNEIPQKVEQKDKKKKQIGKCEKGEGKFCRSNISQEFQKRKSKENEEDIVKEITQKISQNCKTSTLKAYSRSLKNISMNFIMKLEHRDKNNTHRGPCESQHCIRVFKSNTETERQ
jgi:hypothetical protein